MTYHKKATKWALVLSLPLLPSPFNQTSRDLAKRKAYKEKGWFKGSWQAIFHFFFNTLISKSWLHLAAAYSSNESTEKAKNSSTFLYISNSLVWLSEIWFKHNFPGLFSILREILRIRELLCTEIQLGNIPDFPISTVWLCRSKLCWSCCQRLEPYSHFKGTG